MPTPNSEDKILRSLNEAQRRAVVSQAKTVAILAGPGSGKTHTLTSRVVWLVQRVGYRPNDVIVATFTVKAAREMKERIGKALGEESEKKIVLGTFHSIARRYLSIYGKHIGLDSKFGIADDGDSKAIIQRICKRLNLGIEPSFAKSWISKKKAKGPAGALSQTNSKQKENPALQTCYEEYQDQLARSNLLDYDDLLTKCVELLREHPVCVSNVQTVLIDEYQDTNGIQYELMRLLAQANNRITIVGDPDQSIYGWRSAEIKNLYRLLRDYPNTDEISLEENYRSSQSILDVSLNVIQQDKKRYQKVLLPVHTKGARPVLRTLKSSAAEGEWIVSEVKRAIMMFGEMLKNEDVAILLRSAALSRHIESALGKAGVAYRMIGGHKFYDRKEIKVLLDYLRVVYHPDNNDALARIMNVPRRGIGEATIKSLLEEAEKAKMSLWTLLWKHCKGTRKATTNIRAKMEQKLNTELLRVISYTRKQKDQITQSSPFTVVDLIEQLVSQLDFKKYLEEEYPDQHEQRWANVQELVNLAGDFVRDFGASEEDALPEIENLEQVKEDDVLGRFLANVSLASDAQKDDATQDKTSLVTISTIHASKGLEWPIVFVPSVYTGSIPHSRSEDTDEERRLLYVAMTRAKALLYLSCPLYGSQGMSSKVELSPFVAPFASTAFAKRGPSFDRAVVESAAKILGRVAPSEKSVFDKLPPMFSPEDDAFPEDPFDRKTQDGFDDDSGRHHSRAPKRQRTTSYNNESSHEQSDEIPWHREYATTMEQSSGFTVSALPGFTTAGAHKVALDVATAEATAKAPPPKVGPKRGTTRRGADQKSLLGFVTQRSKSNEGPLENKQWVDLAQLKYQAALSRHHKPSAASRFEQPKPQIDPELARHKLTTAKPLAKPTVLKVDDGPKKPYSCFSSSPPHPPSKHEETKDQVEQEAKPIPDRPASSFHATTFTSVKPRRPVGIHCNMSPTLVNRVASPALQASRHVGFSTATPLLKPMTSGPTPASASGFSKWRWSNLSPRTRRYVVVGLLASTCVDTYIFYHYWPQTFGSK
ncbi:P-loop containing nucleoside triphosphate hydrolase protein [Dactylonectria estremocensis]|uniref:DNA 3'-5' helicase n=1 Tax=Dactylonectria estremocensis TaxID=1079267 RepID=A0A9P9FBR3_9HYPO|nr:P-loop containing nucleoside triphosphate hydrolase protein [Dactylonectria estremocensis]